MLFVGKWDVLIPMPTLAGILIMVAWNMSEIDSFRFVLKGSKSDATVLLATFMLTVFVDLTVAIEIGMILAAFLFMRKMMQSSSVLQTSLTTDEGADDVSTSKLPEGVDVFEINGPLFFGAAYKFRDTMKMIENPAKVLIIRMDNVPVIDATGLRVLKDVHQETSKKGSKLILSEISSEQVTSELQKARLLFLIGKANVTPTFEDALQRANDILVN
jgi:SulP family sulfate permease